MELFHRRYLCFFAFLFLLASFVGTLLKITVLGIVIAVVAGLLLIAVVLLTANKQNRFVFAVIVTSLIFTAVALVNSFAFVRIPLSESSKYVGNSYPAEMKILTCEYSGEDASEYSVRIIQMEDEALNVKAYLYCDFPSDLSYGDRVLAVVDVHTGGIGVSGQNADTLLSLSIDSSKPVLYENEEQTNYFSIDGVMVLCHSLREAFGNYVDGLFGKDISALVKGFLINDKSDISSAVRSDFKRSGTLHLLAVSGLHVALLIGSLEVLMKKVYIPKTVRCFIASGISVLFLALTGFAASAVRSVLMLLAVYLSYLLSEDGDSITTLFISISIIILISPFSVYDIGMWMSFFATLGLIAVYPVLEGIIPKIKAKKGILKFLCRAGIFVLKAVLLTLVANFFLLPIMWYFFGEISLAAIPANLILSPLSSAFLPFCAIAVLLGWIPAINELFAFALAFFETLITKTADVFSDMRGAVVSLGYPFASVLVVIFTVTFLLLLIVRLKNKLWICVPPIGFAVIFALCVTVYSINSTPQIKYVTDSENDHILIERAGRTCVCDVSGGGYDSFALLANNIDSCATEIESYVITHCHKGQGYQIKMLLSSFYVRKLYLPLSKDAEELERIAELYLIAAEYDTQVVFYELEKEIELFDGIILTPYIEASPDNGHSSVFVTVSKDNTDFTYCGAYESENAVKMGAKSQYFLLGAHGSVDKQLDSDTVLGEHTTVIFATQSRAVNTRIDHSNAPVYVITPNDNKIKLILPLD